MNPFEMVVVIVAIVMITSIIKSRHRYRYDAQGQTDDAETRMLRDEVKVLKERVAVLERIATDRGSLLEQEIEQLRDQRSALESRSPTQP